MIYEFCFSSITVTQGFGKTGSNHTNLLSTCRQIHNEAKSLLGSNISFHFRRTEEMVDCLTTLSHQQIQQIRHIRVKAILFPLEAFQNAGYTEAYDFADALALFPGLQLDRLEVEDCFHDEDREEHRKSCTCAEVGTYKTIEALLKCDGWKELYYVMPTTDFMCGPIIPYLHRVEQPLGWNRYLQDRDGADSGASVTMFISKNSGSSGMMDDPSIRIPCTAIPEQMINTLRDVVLSEDNQTAVAPLEVPEVDVTTRAAEKREMLLIARRGKNASYIQDGKKLKYQIKYWFDRMTWPEMKENWTYKEGHPRWYNHW